MDKKFHSFQDPSSHPAALQPRVCQNQLGISDASAVRQGYSLLLPVNADHCFTLKIANHRTVKQLILPTLPQQTNLPIVGF